MDARWIGRRELVVLAGEPVAMDARWIGRREVLFSEIDVLNQDVAMDARWIGRREKARWRAQPL
jgi:hypothetical protein